MPSACTPCAARRSRLGVSPRVRSSGWTPSSDTSSRVYGSTCAAGEEGAGGAEAQAASRAADRSSAGSLNRRESIMGPNDTWQM